MACQLCSAKPLPDPMLICGQLELDPQKQTEEKYDL